jgi:uncharacterized protein YdhG (YjbR/CyaY superfamily)
MDSKPLTVAEYTATLPAEVQDRLAQLRETIYEIIPNATEKIRYGMPAVMLGGTYVVHYAAWKHHIGLYPVPPMPEDLEPDVAPYRSTKDTVRLLHKEPMPTDLVKRLLLALVAHRIPVPD